MKINIAEYQVQGFISARSKGIQKAQSAASAAIGEARGETPIALQGAFRSYIRFVRGLDGFEYGWILR
jgi:hypothetical protein